MFVSKCPAAQAKPQHTIMPVFAYTNIVGKMYTIGSVTASMVTQKGVPVSQAWVAIIDKLKATVLKAA